MSVAIDEQRKLKKVHFIVRRFDLACGQNPPVILQEINIPDQCTSDIMLQTIRKDLCLTDGDIVLKLRNHKGSLVIPQGSINANTSNQPYTLDVVKVHQHIKPKGRTINFADQEELMTDQLRSFDARVTRMEEEFPDLCARRQYRIEREIQDADRQLTFLKQRLDDSDDVEWKGMLKRNPLW